jgi:hypothetical protein
MNTVETLLEARADAHSGIRTLHRANVDSNSDLSDVQATTVFRILQTVAAHTSETSAILPSFA